MGSKAMLHLFSDKTWPRRLVLGIACALLAVLALRFTALVFQRYTQFDAKHYGEHWLERWWLIAHLGGGALALLLGPFQFSAYLRRRFVQAHRWIGRLYLVGVLIASIAAVYMGMHAKIRGFGVGLLYLDVAWVVTTSMAYLAVMRRRFDAHRDWMTRSYVVTFAFVVFRWMSINLKLHHNLGLETRLTMLSWLCWAMPLLFTEVALQWRRTVG
jgi:hypothetical protein